MGREVFYTLPVDKLVALTAYGEARNEGAEGMMAVINVIKNRAMNPGKFGDSSIFAATNSVWHAVILKPYQFSIYNSNDAQYSNMTSIAQNFDAMASSNYNLTQALDIARMMLQGKLYDNTGGATYYHATYVTPSWASEIPFIGQIGAHLFYGEKGPVEVVTAFVQTNPAISVALGLGIAAIIMTRLMRRT